MCRAINNAHPLLCLCIDLLCVQITAEGTKQYDSNFNDVKTITVSVDMATTGSGLQTALTGLTPGTDYSIRVAAINGAGTGESSMPITATTNNGMIFSTRNSYVHVACCYATVEPLHRGWSRFSWYAIIINTHLMMSCTVFADSAV